MTFSLNHFLPGIFLLPHTNPHILKATLPQTHSSALSSRKMENKWMQTQKRKGNIPKHKVSAMLKNNPNLLDTQTRASHSVTSLCSIVVCSYELNRARIPSRHSLTCTMSYSSALTYFSQSQFALITQSTRHRRPLHTVEEYYISP